MEALPDGAIVLGPWDLDGHVENVHGLGVLVRVVVELVVVCKRIVRQGAEGGAGVLGGSLGRGPPPRRNSPQTRRPGELARSTWPCGVRIPPIGEFKKDYFFYKKQKCLFFTHFEIFEFWTRGDAFLHEWRSHE